MGNGYSNHLQLTDSQTRTQLSNVRPLFLSIYKLTLTRITCSTWPITVILLLSKIHPLVTFFPPLGAPCPQGEDAGNAVVSHTGTPKSHPQT